MQNRTKNNHNVLKDAKQFKTKNNQKWFLIGIHTHLTIISIGIKKYRKLETALQLPVAQQNFTKMQNNLKITIWKNRILF